MHEDADAPIDIKPRKTKRKKRYDEHKATNTYKLNKQNNDFVEQLSDHEDGDGIDSVGSEVSLGGLLE